MATLYKELNVSNEAIRRARQKLRWQIDNGYRSSDITFNYFVAIAEEIEQQLELEKITYAAVE